MVVQIVSVVSAILALRWDSWPLFSGIFLPVRWIAIFAVWFMVAVSVISCVDYFVGFWKKIDTHAERRRRRRFILSRRKKAAVQSDAENHAKAH
jgi:CDP-diacylglycerol--glycerol-3-phosphate 3-phosphatidyltransferase